MWMDTWWCILYLHWGENTYSLSVARVHISQHCSDLEKIQFCCCSTFISPHYLHPTSQIKVQHDQFSMIVLIKLYFTICSLMNFMPWPSLENGISTDKTPWLVITKASIQCFFFNISKISKPAIFISCNCYLPLIYSLSVQMYLIHCCPLNMLKHVFCFN